MNRAKHFWTISCLLDIERFLFGILHLIAKMQLFGFSGLKCKRPSDDAGFFLQFSAAQVGGSNYDVRLGRYRNLIIHFQGYRFFSRIFDVDLPVFGLCESIAQHLPAAVVLLQLAFDVDAVVAP